MANTISWGQLSWSAGDWGLQDLQEGWGYNTWGTTAWGNNSLSPITQSLKVGLSNGSPPRIAHFLGLTISDHFL